MQETLLGGLYTRGTQRNSNALADTREHGQLLVHSFDSTTPADRQSRATANGQTREACTIWWVQFRGTVNLARNVYSTAPVQLTAACKNSREATTMHQFVQQRSLKSPRT